MATQCGNCVRGVVNGVVCDECQGTALVSEKKETVVEKAVSAVKKAVGKKK